MAFGPVRLVASRFHRQNLFHEYDADAPARDLECDVFHFGSRHPSASWRSNPACALDIYGIRWTFICRPLDAVSFRAQSV